MSESTGITFGGVQIHGTDCIKSRKQLSNGKYQIIFKNGEVLTYNEQKKENEASVGTASTNCINGKPSISINNMEGAVLTGSKKSSGSIDVYKGKNNTIDVSGNNQTDYLYIASSDNIIVKTDNKDKAHGVSSGKKVGDKDRIKYFEHKNQAGTYSYDIGDSFIKRENVPSALLKLYDKIANLNGNNHIDTDDEMNKFKQAALTAYEKKQISDKDLGKMEFTKHDAYKYPKNSENFAVTGGIIGGIVGLGIPIISQMTAAAGAIVGLAAGAVTDAGEMAYDYFSGEMDKKELKHWSVDYTKTNPASQDIK